MDKVFLTVLNMSLTGAFVIAAVILARLPLKRAPKIISYCLWAVVGFRLICPFSFESVLSIVPIRSAPIPINLSSMEHSGVISSIDSGSVVVDSTIETMLTYARTSAYGNPYSAMTRAVSYIWLFGFAAMLLYGIVSYAQLKRRMRTAIRIEGNIYETDNIPSPFVLGIIKPKIYLPLSLIAGEREYIILHERTHIRRHDHIVKFGAYFVLCLHWFDPLAWIAFLLMGVDMEMSCDERVLKEMGDETKHDYSRSLLSLATQRRMIGGSPLAFGEGGVKERVKNVLNFRKPSRVIIVVAVALVAVLSVGFALNRESHPTPLQAFQNFSKIVSYDSKTLQLTIPKDIPSAYKLYIHVSGRRKMDDDAMSFHAFEDESKHYSWELGKTYTYEIARDDLLEGLVVIGLVKNGESEVEYEYQVDFLGATPQMAHYEPHNWLDYYNLRGDESIPYDETLEIELPEFPDTVFSWTAYEVKAIDASVERVLFSGWPIHNVFLEDVQLVVTQTGYLAHNSRIVTGSMSIVDGKLVLYGIDRTLPI